MGEIRQVALNLQQDIATSDDTACVTERLKGKSKTEIEQICSLEIDGRTVFQTIASHDRANIMEKILSYSVNINSVDRFAVHVAISQKAVNVMKILLAHKANIDRATEDGKTPLHIASELGYVKIVRELLEHGAKPLINKPEKTGCTPLTLAVMTDHRETATCLMIYGAAINFEGAFPPLHAAALMGYLDLVRMLLERGAYVNLRDMKGETALHYAAYKSHKQIVHILLQKGAKVSCLDERGKTPLDLASDEEIIQILENKRKTEGSVKVRKDSGPQRPIFARDIPDIKQAILEEEESEDNHGAGNKGLKSGMRNDASGDHKRRSEHSKKDENAAAKEHMNYNNNSASGGASAEPTKKISSQSTYSADSETGESKRGPRRQRDEPSTSRVADEPAEASASDESDGEDNQERDSASHGNESGKSQNKKKKGGCILL